MKKVMQTFPDVSNLIPPRRSHGKAQYLINGRKNSVRRLTFSESHNARSCAYQCDNSTSDQGYKTYRAIRTEDQTKRGGGGGGSSSG